jgi:predicted nucleic acid-binding protein
MSLARTALRLAAVEALTTDAVIAALCDKRVYDSRLTDFDREEPVPVLIVTTDDDQGEAYSQNGGPPFDTTVELSIEIAMKAVAVDDQNQVVGIGSPATDRELEASLDLLEERAVAVLATNALVRKVTRRVTRKKSVRFVTDDVGEKLAVRFVTLTAALKGEERHALDLPTGPFARLPDPLRTVCVAMPEGSSARATCQMIFDALPPLAAEPFTGANLALQPSALSPSGPPVRADQEGANPEIHDNTHRIP